MRNKVKKEGKYHGDYSNKYGTTFDIYEKAKEQARKQKLENIRKNTENENMASSQPHLNDTTIVERKIRKRSLKMHLEK